MSSDTVAVSAADSRVLPRLLVKYCIAALIMGAILYFTSGRSDWTRAWAYLGFVFIGQTAAGLALYRAKPDLMAERSKLQQGTKSWDKLLVAIVAFLGPFAFWATAGFDVRAHWPPPVPLVWSMAGLAGCAAAFAITLWAMWTNRFFSATVRIQSDRGQTVVSTGPYAIVRHPGYSGILLFTMASPIALGSWIALIPAALTAVVLVIRTLLEDRTLRSELNGYDAYTTRVRFRLIPGVW